MAAHLPGQSVGVSDDEWGTKCYTHHDVDATHRICSESDSFGSEYVNLCEQCWDAHLAHKEKVKSDESLWETCKCGNREPRMISYRDYEEGMHGSVYEHCSKCHAKMNARIAEEEAYYDDDDDWCGSDDYDTSEEDLMFGEGLHDVILDEKTAIYLRDMFIAQGFPFTELMGPITQVGDPSEEKHYTGLMTKVMDKRAFKRLSRRLDAWYSENTSNGWLDGKLSEVCKADGYYQTMDLVFGSHTVNRKSKARSALKSKLFHRLFDKSNKIKLGAFIKPEYTIKLEIQLYV